MSGSWENPEILRNKFICWVSLMNTAICLAVYVALWQPCYLPRLVVMYGIHITSNIHHMFKFIKIHVAPTTSSWINFFISSDANLILNFHSTTNHSEVFVLHIGKRWKANYAYMRTVYRVVQSVGLRNDPCVHYRSAPPCQPSERAQNET
jgi:hypothetical protein